MGGSESVFRGLWSFCYPAISQPIVTKRQNFDLEGRSLTDRLYPQAAQGRRLCSSHYKCASRSKRNASGTRFSVVSQTILIRTLTVSDLKVDLSPRLGFETASAQPLLRSKNRESRWHTNKLPHWSPSTHKLSHRRFELELNVPCYGRSPDPQLKSAFINYATECRRRCRGEIRFVDEK